jgi:predicted alpha/beta superfamily hydrolase
MQPLSPRFSFLLKFATSLVFAYSSTVSVAQLPIKEQIYGRSEAFEISSKQTGDVHPVSVYLPPGYDSDPNASYPVLVLLDSNLLFGEAQTAINLFALEGSITPPILVGVGYRGDDFDSFMKKRMRYFASAVETDNSGAEGFSRFLEKELLPQIARRYKADASHQTLFASALPGLFGAYELFNESTPFNNFILAGPRLWWNEGAFFQHEQGFSETNTTLNAHVFASVGLADDKKYVDAWRRFVSVLQNRSYQGLTLETDSYEMAGHFDGMMEAIIHGIRAIYKKPAE